MEAQVTSYQGQTAYDEGKEVAQLGQTGGTWTSLGLGVTPPPVGRREGWDDDLVPPDHVPTNSNPSSWYNPSSWVVYDDPSPAAPSTTFSCSYKIAGVVAAFVAAAGFFTAAGLLHDDARLEIGFGLIGGIFTLGGSIGYVMMKRSVEES